MKKIIVYSIVFLTVLQACKKSEAPLTNSGIDTSAPILNATDKWLEKNFTDPYNIEVTYKWNENKVDQYRYLYPPTIEKVLPAAKAIKTVWLDSYTQVGGKDFLKKVAPRELNFNGGVNKNSSGTVILGFAEAGMKISLFEINTLDLKNKGKLLRFVGTIQHEYTHILNQTKPFDEKRYKLITPEGYTAQWYNYGGTEAYNKGFISSYARASYTEDFAEMVRVMLSNTKVDYDRLIDRIGVLNGKAKEDLRKKEQIIVAYFKKKYDVDFYKLQEVVAKNVNKILK